MASSGKIPGPYVNSVPEAGTDPIMEYPPLHNMGIGSRKSGMPGMASTGPKSLDHVGGSAGASGKEGK